MPSYSVESMERALKAGMLEWYVDGASGPRPSIENINVVWESLRAARTEVELETARRSITKLCDELSLASGRPLEVHSCEFVGLEELAAVRMHFDHPVPQTHCVQYQLAHEVRGRLVFTIASGDSTWKATDASLQQMLGTLRFVEPKSSPIQLGQ